MTHSSFPKQEFSEIKKLNPYWSSYICFAEVIKNKPFLHTRTIRRYFNNLVEKGDYDRPAKEQVIKFLFNIASGKEK